MCLGEMRVRSPFDLRRPTPHLDDRFGGELADLVTRGKSMDSGLQLFRLGNVACKTLQIVGFEALCERQGL